ncbi:hypothetical protein A2U01_0056100, partial [Trifolium medium]|nr:hypothetical protein [Trifolium medium]
VECGNQVVNHDDYWATQVVDPVDWTNHLDPDIFNWASQPDEFSCKDVSQLADFDNWIIQLDPDIFN